MAEVHLKQRGFILTVLVNHLLKTKKELKNSKKQKIHDIFIKNELDKAASMTWFST